LVPRSTKLAISSSSFAFAVQNDDYSDLPKARADTPLSLIPTPIFITKKVSSCPFEKKATELIFSYQHDMFTAGASHMCMVHNSIFRGYNSIYHQALNVAEADKADFIGYCLTWHKFLKSHAENEEMSLFLKTEELLDDKTIWEESHKEHGKSVTVCGRVKDGDRNFYALRCIHAQNSQVP
jgi:hypothetical protein